MNGVPGPALTLLAIVLAVLAAGANASASVLQRKAARTEPDSQSFSIGLLWDLAHRPVWIAGILTVLVGFLLQAAALGSGTIVLVQPLLVLELPFTLLIASRVLGGGVNAREWTAIICMAAGVALLLAGLAPHGGNPNTVGLPLWIGGLVVTVLAVAGFVAAGMRRPPTVRAALLGIATGIAFGFTAVLVKAITGAFAAGGLTGVFTSWQTYVLVVAGPGGFFLLQNALQAGRLVASQPGMTLMNPATAIVWGIAILGERVRVGELLALAALGAVLLAGGTILLSSSSLFHEHHHGKRGSRGRAR
jgi:drug/metabolite transporter (DMT)-like permease